MLCWICTHIAVWNCGLARWRGRGDAAPQRPPPPAARTGGGGGAGPGAGHATPRTGDGATTDAHAPRPRDERRTRYVPSADVRRLSTDAFIIATVVPGASACVRLRLRLRTPWSVHRGWYRSRSAIPLSWPVLYPIAINEKCRAADRRVVTYVLVLRYSSRRGAGAQTDSSQRSAHRHSH